MKPRTKLQAQVFSLSQYLPELTADQKKWAFKNCIRHQGYRTLKHISCMDCGNIWSGPQKVKKCNCPNCGEKLIIEDTRKKNLKQDAIVALVNIIEDFQVIRFFEIKVDQKAGCTPKVYTREIVQQWFKPGEKLTIVGRTQSYGNGGFGGDMEIRANISNYYSSNKYDIYADKIFPEFNCLPIFKRNGFTSKVAGVNLYSMLIALLRDSKIETLLKADQHSLLAARLGDRNDKVYRYWDSIKICIRNKYLVKDAVSYLDYLDLLNHYGRDLRNAKYVCPSNFKKEHNRLVSKRAKEKRFADAIRNLEQAEKRKLLAEQEQQTYLKEKSPYFGIIFSDGELTIKILESVKEFIAEGDHHKHCIYTNRYYSKPDSLCFSAKIEGDPVETIELSLTNMKIIQSRGKNNEPSIHHDKIINLMKKNISVIKNRYRDLKKEVA
ncbi:hypothetical protein AY601_4109 [Pedobacter cryoconitis]|uniref:PcfJ-like protein n=1 Tax=Pedobacter cryoconitis TaxID=188932 RepID=A0A127VI51_9SPHI|nr:PcfJ domain-containing protein [Pedobacter cryoconitis]AMQ00960.1 hypothetical protein AY601_4109 [Pedobacter cryoconitis]